MPDTMAPPAPPVSAPPTPPGSTAPSTMPPRNAGMEAQASVIMSGVATVITKALAMLDPMGDKARAARKALDLITKEFGPASPDLMRAQVKTFAAAAPPMPPGPGAQPAAQKLGSMGLQPQPSQPPS